MTDFSALPPSWTALSSMRKLVLKQPGPLDAEGALQPLGSWTQLTSLHIYDGGDIVMDCMPGSLEQQLTRLSALQDLRVEQVWGALSCRQGAGKPSSPSWSARCNTCWAQVLVRPGRVGCWSTPPRLGCYVFRTSTMSPHSQNCTRCWARWRRCLRWSAWKWLAASSSARCSRPTPRWAACSNGYIQLEGNPFFWHQPSPCCPPCAHPPPSHCLCPYLPLPPSARLPLDSPPLPGGEGPATTTSHPPPASPPSCLPPLSPPFAAPTTLYHPSAPFATRVRVACPQHSLRTCHHPRSLYQWVRAYMRARLRAVARTGEGGQAAAAAGDAGGGGCGDWRGAAGEGGWAPAVAPPARSSPLRRWRGRASRARGRRSPWQAGSW